MRDRRWWQVEPPAARPGLRRPLRRRSPKAVGVGRSRHLLRPTTSRKSSGPGTFFQARVTTRQSRSFSSDGHDTSQVKGDDSEEKTESESDARIEQAARATRLQDDLLFLNDVVRQQVQQASDSL